MRNPKCYHKKNASSITKAEICPYVLDIDPLMTQMPSQIPFLCCSVTKSFLILIDPMDCSIARLPCPSLSHGVRSNSCPLSQWCHPTISSSAAFFSCSQSFPALGSFPMSWLFTVGGKGIGASASVSVFSVNIQG